MYTSQQNSDEAQIGRVNYYFNFSTTHTKNTMLYTLYLMSVCLKLTLPIMY